MHPFLGRVLLSVAWKNLSLLTGCNGVGVACAYLVLTSRILFVYPLVILSLLRAHSENTPRSFVSTCNEHNQTNNSGRLQLCILFHKSFATLQQSCVQFSQREKHRQPSSSGWTPLALCICLLNITYFTSSYSYQKGIRWINGHISKTDPNIWIDVFALKSLFSNLEMWSVEWEISS